MKPFPAFARTALSLSVALSANTLAQSSSYDPRTLEEVIVTAQKVSESLQNVPISVSVASAQDIADINAFEFKDLKEITPGVEFGEGGLQNVAIRVRGVGPAFFAAGTPPNVAVFVDQVGQSQIGAVFSTLVDIQRVELLRGPQGTLYGRNAPSGAYNISTKEPNHDGFNGYVEGSYSSYDSSDMITQDVRAAVNIPIVEDKLALRLAGVYSESDGFIEMANPAANEDTTGGKDNQAIRARLLWNATPDMDFLLTSNYQDLEQNPGAFNYDGLVPGSGGDEPVPAVYNDFEDRKNYGDRRSVVDGDLKDVSLHWRWDYELFNVDAIAFYQEFDTFNDQNRAPYFGGQEAFMIGIDSDITTFEVRLSDTSDAFDYVAGLYYFDNSGDGTTDVQIPGNPGEPPTQVVIGSEFQSEGYAAFGNINFHLSPQWDLAVGARYDDNSDELQVFGDVAGFVQLNIDEDDLEFDHVSWSVKLRNYINENLTAYLSVDSAYRQGGFNPFVAGAIDLSERLPGSVTPPVEEAIAESLTYDEETSDAIELGIKGTFLDNRLRISAALFYQVFDDHQIAQTNQGIPALDQGPLPYGAFFTSTITNADEVITRGVEFDAIYLMGDNWDVAWRGSFSDPIIEDWDSRYCPSGEAEDPTQLYCPKDDGDSLNNLPRWNSNVQVGYQAQVFGSWEFYSRVSWTWQSKPSGNNITNDFREDKSLIGLNFGMRENSLGLDIKAWAKNITDEYLTVDPGLKQRNDAADAFVGTFTPGREYGLTVRYNF